MLRLLTLPESVIAFLEESKITIGHARSLVGLPDAVAVAKKVISKQLSVRQTEALVKQIRLNSSSPIVKRKKLNKKNIDTLNLEKTLTFQTKFTITIEQNSDNRGGQLIFNYNDLHELDKICDFLYQL